MQPIDNSRSSNSSEPQKAPLGSPPTSDPSTNTNPPARWCGCGRGRRRPGAYDCLACHREAAARSLAKRNKRMHLLEKQIEHLQSLFCNNPPTRERFMRRFGSDRRISVKEHRGNPYGWHRAVVIGFLPGDVVLTRREFDASAVLHVHLNDLEADDRLACYRPEVTEPLGDVTNKDVLRMIFGVVRTQADLDAIDAAY